MLYVFVVILNASVLHGYNFASSLHPDSPEIRHVYRGELRATEENENMTLTLVQNDLFFYFSISRSINP